MFLSNNTKEVISETQNSNFLHAFSYGFSAIIAQILMMFYTVIVARWLTSEYYGVLSACYAMASLASFAINWGFDIWLLKEASASRDPLLITSSIIRVKLILGIIWTIILWSLLQIIQPLLYVKDISFMVIVDIWCEACFTTLLVHFVVVKEVTSASKFLILSRLLRLLSAVLLIAFNIYSLFNFSLFRLLSTLTILVIVWSTIKPKVISANNITIKVLFKSSLPFTISELINNLYIQCDVNILSIFLGNRKIIGNYSLAINLINAILTLPYGIINVFIPNLIREKDTNPHRFYRLLWILYFISSSLGILIMIALWYFSDLIVNLFLGESYFETGRLLVLLCPIILIKCINQVTIASIITVNLQSKRIMPQVTSLGIKILSSLWIVPQWQQTGLAILSIFSEGMLFLGYLLVTFRYKHKFGHLKY
ncbi:MAG: oligosaccharide flippase family protein [Chloroflexi bacterium]|nr:oligosaccharide flippase family protein [Chloroflexota bacterium]